MTHGKEETEHIKDLREDADLNQEQVTQVLHISQGTYSRYESGVLDIPTTTLIRLAQFYQTSVDYLLDLTNERTPPPRRRKGPQPP